MKPLLKFIEQTVRQSEIKRMSETAYNHQSTQQRQSANHHSDLESTFSWLDKKDNVLIHSAHHEPRDGIVQVVGLHRRYKPFGINVVCEFGNGFVSYMSLKYNHSMPDKDIVLYDSMIYACPYEGSEPPRTVNLRSVDTTVSLPVSAYGGSAAAKMGQLVVCVKPMSRNYSNTYQLKEFIEVNRLLGADLIVLYPNDVTPPVTAILSMYKIDLKYFPIPSCLSDLSYGMSCPVTAFDCTLRW